MAFKQNTDGTIEICCMGLLRFLGRENVEVSGLLMKYPGISLAGADKLHFCPICGKELNPENNTTELFNGEKF